MTDVVLIVFYNSHNQTVLSERRSPSHPMYPNMTTFPTGKVQKGETVEQALIREVQEEFGVAVIESIPLSAAPLINNGAQTRLYPFFIKTWKGSLPQKVLDKGTPLVWETFQEASSSSISTRGAVITLLQTYLQTFSP